MRQFFELYDVAAKHLKSCFPHLKIGGPAVCYPIKEWVNAFLGFCRDSRSPLDFFSWHQYARSPRQIERTEAKTRELLDSYGFMQTESICN